MTLHPAALAPTKQGPAKFQFVSETFKLFFCRLFDLPRRCGRWIVKMCVPRFLFKTPCFPVDFNLLVNYILDNIIVMTLNIGPARDWSSGCLPPERAPRLRRSRLLDNYLAFHVHSQHRDPPRPLCRLLHPVWKLMFNVQQQQQQQKQQWQRQRQRQQQ